MNLKNILIPAALCLLLVPVPASSAVVCANENIAVAETTPTAVFVDNGDGTVIDSRTGLIWMRCSVGQIWNGSDCATGTSATYTWQGALQLALDVNSGAGDPDGDGQAGFAGYTDWRLPNIAELGSIVEERCWSPAVNEASFPDTPASGTLWSSSPSVGNPGLAWNVGLSYGKGGVGGKNSTRYVRLVRSGPGCPPGEVLIDGVCVTASL